MKTSNDERFEKIDKLLNSEELPKNATESFREVEYIILHLLEINKNQEQRIKELEGKPSNI